MVVLAMLTVGFHPTLVRLEEFSKLTHSPYPPKFPSHIGSIRSGLDVSQVIGGIVSFHPTLVRLEVAIPEARRVSVRPVSIPHWFD